MKRAGGTRTLSISLAEEPLKTLQRRAKQVHGGNISAAVAEAIEFLRRDVAMGELVSTLEQEHGALTDAERRAFDAELQAKPARKKRPAA